MKPAIPVAIVTALLALGLSACSAGSTTSGAPTASSSAATGSGASGQTKAQACSALSKPLESGVSTLKTAYGEVTKNPQAALTALTTFTGEFDAATKTVTNADVAAQAQKAQASLASLGTAASNYVADGSLPNIAKVQSTATAFQKDFAALGKLCG